MASKSLRDVLRGQCTSEGLEALRTDPRRPLVWGRLPTLDVDRVVLESLLEYDVGLGEVGGRRRIVTMQWISLQRASQQRTSG